LSEIYLLYLFIFFYQINRLINKPNPMLRLLHFMREAQDDELGWTDNRHADIHD
jgi:hypothetical protein